MGTISSARELARRLLGGEAVAGWTVVDVRASSGLRVTFERLIGRPEGEDEQRQTNALALAEGDLAVRLAAAGARELFVSLHSRLAHISDRVFSFMSPVGAALHNLGLIPTMTSALPPPRAALDDCLAHHERVRVAGVCGLPPCLLRGYESICDEAENPPGIALSDDRAKPEVCRARAHDPRCSGVRRRCIELHGASELAPITVV
jgi:hypothetical protein